MYVDIGMDLAVRASQVLGVFDLDNTSWSKRTPGVFAARAGGWQSHRSNR